MPRKSGCISQKIKRMISNKPGAVYSISIVLFLVIYFVFPRTIIKQQRIKVPVKSNHSKSFNALSDIDKVAVRRILDEFEQRNIYSYPSNLDIDDDDYEYGGPEKRRSTIDLVSWYDNVFDIALAIKNAEDCKLNEVGDPSTGVLGEVSGAANSNSYDLCITKFLRAADLYSNFVYNYTTDIFDFDINDWTLFDFDMSTIQRSLPTYTTYFGKIYKDMTFIDTTGISVANDYDVIDWAEAEYACNNNKDAIGYVFAAIYGFMGDVDYAEMEDIIDIQETKPKIILIKSIPSKPVFDYTMGNMIMCLKN